MCYIIARGTGIPYMRVNPCIYFVIIHYGNDTWVQWYLKSLKTRLWVQQLVQTWQQRNHKWSVVLYLCEANPVVPCGFLSKGTNNAGGFSRLPYKTEWQQVLSYCLLLHLKLQTGIFSICIPILWCIIQSRFEKQITISDNRLPVT